VLVSSEFKYSHGDEKVGIIDGKKSRKTQLNSKFEENLQSKDKK